MLLAVELVRVSWKKCETKSGKSSQSSLMDADEAELLEEHANIYIPQPS